MFKFTTVHEYSIPYAKVLNNIKSVGGGGGERKKEKKMGGHSQERCSTVLGSLNLEDTSWE